MPIQEWLPYQPPSPPLQQQVPPSVKSLVMHLHVRTHLLAHLVIRADKACKKKLQMLIYTDNRNKNAGVTPAFCVYLHS